MELLLHSHTATYTRMMIRQVAVGMVGEEEALMTKIMSSEVE